MAWTGGPEVVDDEPDVVEMRREDVTQAAFAADTALNGGEALMLIQHARPNLILLDIHIPRMDGVAVLERIRATDATIPVITVTANADVRVVERALRTGASPTSIA